MYCATQVASCRRAKPGAFSLGVNLLRDWGEYLSGIEFDLDDVEIGSKSAASAQPSNIGDPKS